MSLVPEQAAFLLDVCKLVQFATKYSYVVTGGELWRPVEMQELYVKTGRSKTMDSQHLNRLAIDLNIFENGVLCTHDAVKPLGKFWESLNVRNRWGGSWRGEIEAGRSTFIDVPHFERQV